VASGEMVEVGAEVERAAILVEALMTAERLLEDRRDPGASKELKEIEERLGRFWGRCA